MMPSAFPLGGPGGFDTHDIQHCFGPFVRWSHHQFMLRCGLLGVSAASASGGKYVLAAIQTVNNETKLFFQFLIFHNFVKLGHSHRLTTPTPKKTPTLT